MDGALAAGPVGVDQQLAVEWLDADPIDRGAKVAVWKGRGVDWEERVREGAG